MALVNCPECGKEVSESAVSCPNCGYGVANHFNEIKKEMLKEHLQFEIAEKKKKLVKKLKIIIPCAVVAVGVAVGFAVNSAVLSKRMTFETEEDMYNYLCGVYCWNYDDRNYLLFNEYGLVERIWTTINSCVGDSEIELSPSRGKFKFYYNDYTISSDGNIVDSDGNIYHSSAWSNIEEIPSLVLNIKVNNGSIDKNLTYNGEYSVTNTGKSAYTSIVLETTLKLEDGSKVILDDYALVKKDDDYTLQPGETGTATATMYNAPNNALKYSVRVKRYMTDVSSIK